MALEAELDDEEELEDDSPADTLLARPQEASADLASASAGLVAHPSLFHHALRCWRSLLGGASGAFLAQALLLHVLLISQSPLE